MRRQTLLERYGRGLEEVVFHLPNGRTQTYVIKKERPTVAILAITKNERVIVVEQFRPGPKAVLRELPGGYIDAGESPLPAARRELREETGYVGSFRKLVAYVDCAYTSRVRHCFLATRCHPISGRRRHSAEADRRVVLVPLRQWTQNLFHTPPTDLACALAGLRALKVWPMI